jgi:hypothetical protein
MAHFLAFLIHLGQGATLLTLGIVYRNPIYVQNRYPTGPPGSVVMQTASLETLPVAVSASVLFMSALYHAAIVMSMWGRCDVYEGDFKMNRGYEEMLRPDSRNWWRWLHYAGTSVAVMLNISLLTGVTDLTALIAVSGCSLAMVLFWEVSERMKRTSEWKMAFTYGTLTGLVPWVCILLQFGRNAATVGGANVSALVYAVIFTMFFLVLCLGILEWTVIYYEVSKKKTWLSWFGADEIVNAEHIRTILTLITNSVLGWLTYKAVQV